MIGRSFIVADLLPTTVCMILIIDFSRCTFKRGQSSTWGLLHFSCSRGFLDITRMLLEAGAKPMDAVDKVRVGFPSESMHYIRYSSKSQCPQSTYTDVLA